MKIMFEVEIDETRPMKRSSGGSPKWSLQTEFKQGEHQYMIYLDIYQKVQQKKAEPKPAAVVKAKAA